MHFLHQRLHNVCRSITAVPWQVCPGLLCVLPFALLVEPQQNVCCHYVAHAFPNFAHGMPRSVDVQCLAWTLVPGAARYRGGGLVMGYIRMTPCIKILPWPALLRRAGGFINVMVMVKALCVRPWHSADWGPVVPACMLYSTVAGRWGL